MPLIVNGALPVLLTVTGNVAVPPTDTLPKAKDGTLRLNTGAVVKPIPVTAYTLVNLQHYV